MSNLAFSALPTAFSRSPSRAARYRANSREKASRMDYKQFFMAI